ncbi:TetR/AcrR family transcriptional regulator [Dehalobacter restrictus]|uniref:TetR family transcriptional regulator n=1 Tax=Dehalobacter restrictus TaxID=55583 RepID=A0A857DM42_9FIRM|nr:TetR/AcrR family transcriptional regulator [Dehalobacter restrictus]QHA01186.1 TetR family transcriptional regulator [Dehalobacter restrictus]
MTGIAGPKKSIQTKRIFMDAFIALNHDKMIDKMSIKELCNRVGLNRGTFYLHFQDIYDLREQIENELLNGMKEIFLEFSKDIIIIKDPHIARNAFSSILAYIQKHHLYFEALLGPTGDISFINKIKNYVKLLLVDNLLLRDKENNINKDYYELILEYGLSANVGIIMYWMKNGMKIPIDELVTLYNELMFNGLAQGILTPNTSSRIPKEV